MDWGPGIHWDFSDCVKWTHFFFFFFLYHSQNQEIDTHRQAKPPNAITHEGTITPSDREQDKLTPEDFPESLF